MSRLTKQSETEIETKLCIHFLETVCIDNSLKCFPDRMIRLCMFPARMLRTGGKSHLRLAYVTFGKFFFVILMIL